MENSLHKKAAKFFCEKEGTKMYPKFFRDFPGKSVSALNIFLEQVKFKYCLQSCSYNNGAISKS